MLHEFGARAPEGYVEFALRHGVDVLTQPVHWGGKEAEEKLAEDVAAHAAAQDAARAKAAAQAHVEDLAFGY